MRTPEFLIWALEHACPLRGSQDGSDPERTERQLRTARAVSDARRAGRVFDGLCVDPPWGFRMEEALAIYGGEAAARQACGNCPANALTEAEPGSLAGCFGMLALPDDPTEFHAAMERGFAKVGGPPDRPRRFPDTRPRWYGLWIRPIAEADALLELLVALKAADIPHQGLRELLLALNLAYSGGCKVYARLFPPGCIDGPWWRLAPHCPRCKAAWRAAGSRECRVCDYCGHPAPENKRHTRGRRPYYPLARLLGSERAAAEFLNRYAARPKPPGRPDRA